MAVTMPPQVPKPPTSLGSPTPSGGKMSLLPINRGTSTPIKKPLPNRGVKSPPIVPPTKKLNPTSLGRGTASGQGGYKLSSPYRTKLGNKLKYAAAKRIASGGKTKVLQKSPLKNKKMARDWATAVKNNPKGINFAALRKNDKTWKGSK